MKIYLEIEESGRKLAKQVTLSEELVAGEKRLKAGVKFYTRSMAEELIELVIQDRKDRADGQLGMEL